MPMPTFRCPVCRNALTVDVVFAHDGVRDAILALVNAHPEAARLLRPLLGYVGLFAPAKTEMRYERIAALLAELVPMIRAGQIERSGRQWPAPVGYWCQALDEMLAKRDTGALRLPLASHGYLLSIIEGFSNKAEARAEATTEARRAGHAGHGVAPERAVAAVTAGPAPMAAVVAPAAPAKSEMPAQVREQLKQLTKRITHGSH